MENKQTGICILAILLCQAVHSYGANILMIPGLLNSHMAVFSPVANELLKAGHKIHTLISDKAAFPAYFKKSNRTVIMYKSDSTFKFEELYERVVEVSISENGNMKNVYNEISSVVTKDAHALLMNNEDVMNELNSLKFDLAVVDGLAFSRYKYLVPHRLGIPVVTLTDGVEPWVTRVPWIPSFVPLFLLPLSDKMSFMERVQNMMVYVALHFVSFAPKLTSDILVKYSNYGVLKSADDVAKKSLLWIITTDAVLDYPRPRMPNMIEVGGLTTKPGTPLSPQWLRTFDKAAHGVVLVSFGSVVSTLPCDIARTLLLAFGSLQETVIWRFKNKDQLTIPDNVVISDWLPQNDMLAHSKVKVFVTHCGTNAQFEAIYHGIPMIGMPIFGDQHYNARRMAQKGYGLQVDIKSFTRPELLQTIKEVIENPIYREKVAKASLIFHDRHENPAEKAATCINHVLTFGAEHLSSYASDMPLYQFLMLDVLMVMCVLGIVMMVLVKWIIGIVWRLCFKSNTYHQKLKAQ